MKRITLALVTLFLAVTQLKAEGERFEEFKRIFTANHFDNDSAYNFLQQWEAAEPTDAEMFYAHFIYNYLIAMPQITQVEDLKEFEHTAMLPDTLTRFGQLKVNNLWIMKDAGTGMEHYIKAIDYIRKDISLHPDILELYTNFSESLFWKNETRYATALAIDMLTLHRQNPNRWTDFYDHPFDQNVEEMLQEHMNTVIGQLVDKNELELATILNDSLISMYPDLIVFRFNRGVIYLQSFQKEKALDYFLSLLNDFPDDGNTLNAIARTYKDIGDLENARKYATMLSQSTDNQWAAQGQQVLADLEPFCIDFEAIEQWMQEHRSDYDELIERFRSGDTGLNLVDLSRIYFGQALTEQYTGTQLWPINLDSLFQTQDFEACLTECQRCLGQHPASIAALAFAFLSTMQISQARDEQHELMPLYYQQLSSLIQMIHKDADDVASGKSKDNLFGDLGTKYYKILWRADENAFVDYLMPEEDKAKTYFFCNPGYFH